MLGIYIHIPFCRAKCGYCDFYSLVGDDATKEAYTAEVCRRLRGLHGRTADTLYIGGGTPSQLGGRRIADMIAAARPLLTADAEITVEANPCDDMGEFLPAVAAAGVNRLSLGMQSAVDSELKLLTRRHSYCQVAAAVAAARAAGIDNVSLDLMIGIEGQTSQSLCYSIDRCAELGADHVSAYMLKLEEGTPFYSRGASSFADADEAADLYLLACERLAAHGYEQYEISNFCRGGKRSRHNLKYWLGQPYIGIGPAAHSCFGGRRFYYERDLAAFLSGAQPVDDGKSGGEEEYVMLRLRLSEGIDLGELAAQFGAASAERVGGLSRPLIAAGLMESRGNRIALTPKGMLVSNSIICKLTD